MGSPTVGDVIVIAFPFADFSNFKMRPAVIVAKAEFDNFIVCQVTSKKMTSKRAFSIGDQNFSEGTLRISSYARPDKLFTIEKSIIQKKIAKLNTLSQKDLGDQIKALF